MAMPQPQTTSPATQADRGGPRWAWVFWVAVTVVGASLAAVLSWQIDSGARSGSASFQLLARFVGAVLDGILIGGAQWFLLRRYKLDVFWWVPASIIANLVADLVIVPPLINVALGSGLVQITSHDGALVLGTASLIATGLVVGGAQALVLRTAKGNIALLWIPATLLGEVVAALIDNVTAPVLVETTLRLSLPVAVVIGAVAASGGLGVSICQAPVLARLLRRPATVD